MSNLAWSVIDAYQRAPWDITAREYDQLLDLIAAATNAHERDYLLVKSLAFIHGTRHSLADAVRAVEARVLDRLIRLEVRK